MRFISQVASNGEIVYADQPLYNKPAIPPTPIDRVIYSDAKEVKSKDSQGINVFNSEQRSEYQELNNNDRLTIMNNSLRIHSVQ